MQQQDLNPKRLVAEIELEMKKCIKLQAIGFEQDPAFSSSMNENETLGV